MKDSLGDRMKEKYERSTQMYLPRRTYTILRLDGKSFHTYTKGMDKPFDATFADDMWWTTKYLCEEIQGCEFGYTQSDEISLLLTDFATVNTDMWFGGNVQKMVSVSAAICSSVFNSRRETDEYGQAQPLAYFDSRVFTIPDRVEVENYFIWRQKDAIRNSISSVAQFHFSPKQLHGKSTTDRLMMLADEGDPWEMYPDWARMGQLVVKKDSEDENEGSNFVYNRVPNFVEKRTMLTELIPNHGY